MRTRPPAVPVGLPTGRHSDSVLISQADGATHDRQTTFPRVDCIHPDVAAVRLRVPSEQLRQWELRTPAATQLQSVHAAGRYTQPSSSWILKRKSSVRAGRWKRRPACSLYLSHRYDCTSFANPMSFPRRAKTRPFSHSLTKYATTSFAHLLNRRMISATAEGSRGPPREKESPHDEATIVPRSGGGCHTNLRNGMLLLPPRRPLARESPLRHLPLPPTLTPDSNTPCDFQRRKPRKLSREFVRIVRRNDERSHLAALPRLRIAGYADNL
jgi:hypothetical protein